MFKAAVLANAATVLLAHNHPSGNPEPSRENVAVTKPFVEAERVMGVPVHDPLVIAGSGYTSLAERGLTWPTVRSGSGASRAATLVAELLPCNERRI